MSVSLKQWLRVPHVTFGRGAGGWHFPQALKAAPVGGGVSAFSLKEGVSPQPSVCPCTLSSCLGFLLAEFIYFWCSPGYVESVRLSGGHCVWTQQLWTKLEWSNFLPWAWGTWFPVTWMKPNGRLSQVSEWRRLRVSVLWLNLTPLHQDCGSFVLDNLFKQCGLGKAVS